MWVHRSRLLQCNRQYRQSGSEPFDLCIAYGSQAVKRCVGSSVRHERCLVFTVNGSTCLSKQSELMLSELKVLGLSSPLPLSPTASLTTASLTTASLTTASLNGGVKRR
jgi:hypothetical protein